MNSFFSFFRSATLLFTLASFAAQPAAAQSGTSDPYRIGAGDIVSIAVYGDEGLSGVFPVAPDGSIAYPILGNVSVGGLTPAEIGEKIDEALADYIPGLTVTAAISQYAPVFIIGDIQKPGQYEYRPGMIALELVALGGGIRNTPESLDSLQLIAAQQEYADLSLQIFAQQVRRARVQAELTGGDFTFPVPERVEPAVHEIRRSIIEGEEDLFKMRRNALVSEQEALAAQEQSYAEEIEALEASIKLHEEELDLLSQDVASTRDLTNRGLTAKSNLREVERRLSAARRDGLELGSYLARARQNQLAFRQRRQALEETRRKEAAESVQEIELDLARMRARQRSVLDTIAEAALSLQGEEAGLQRELTFSVLRNVEGELREMPVDQRASLKPGDILQAQLAPLPEPVGPAAAASQERTREAIRFSSAASQR